MPTALVTGAAHGIGKAIAAALAAEHCDLHLICRESVDELREQAAGLENSFHVSVSADAVDVSDAAAVERYFAEKVRRLDLLVNNAGISRIGLLQDTSVAEWNTVISTNLSSVFYTCRCAIPLFLKSGSGRIINISSVWGSAGASMETAYSASKAALIGLTKALAKELGPSGITVNCVAPGVIDTDMNRDLGADTLAALAEETPLCRIGTPEEAAEAVAFLVSDRASFITGQVLSADGGFAV